MRHEFTRKTKRAALLRSGGLCEGRGEVYGLAPGERCNAPLAYGVEFDHYPVPAGVEGSDSVDNCCCVCPTCHDFKTRHYDIPMQAKDKNTRDRHQGVKKPSKWRRRADWKPTPTKYVDRED